MFFRFPPDARWSPERAVVEFGIGVGEYEGVVRVSRRVFQILLLEALTPKRCLEAYHLHPTRLELIAERKVRRRQLTDDGNVEITPICPTCGSFAEGGHGGEIALVKIAGRKCCSVPDPAHRRLAEDVRFPVTSVVEKDPTQFDALSTR